MMLRPEVPNRTSLTGANAAVLKNWSGLSGDRPTSARTWSAVWELPGAFRLASDAVMVKGLPPTAVRIPLTCQPESNRLCRPELARDLPGPNGRS